MKKGTFETDTVNDWIICCLTNSLTPNDRQSLREWLNESEANRTYFADMQEIWVAAVDETNEMDFDKENAYQLFLERANTASLSAQRSKKPVCTTIVRVRPWMYVAATLLIFILSTTYAFYKGENGVRNQLKQLIVSEAPLGSRSKLFLPDGTLVWLNAGSKISYAQDFGINERVLTLIGEAYFEVIKNEQVPFIVHTNELNVKVLGTKFDFRNYEDDLEAKVSLLEGKVALCTQDTQTVLMPNQQALLNKRTGVLHVSNTKAAYSTEWKDGRLYFNDVLLPDIAKELERSYNVKIMIADSGLEYVRFYGYFRRTEHNIQDIMNMLSSTGKMTYTMHGKNIVITLPE